MSRNKAAFRESVSDRPSHYKLSPIWTGEPGEATPQDKLENLKNLVSVLLREVQALSHDLVLQKASEGIRQCDIENGINLVEEVRRYEKSLIRLALERTGRNQARAARLLGINATTLNYKIKLYHL
jgi:DNA-binding NtrC family response regulator